MLQTKRMQNRRIFQKSPKPQNHCNFLSYVAVQLVFIFCFVCEIVFWLSELMSPLSGQL